jgi:hypothetical protein
MTLKEELLIKLVNAFLKPRIVLCFHQMCSVIDWQLPGVATSSTACIVSRRSKTQLRLRP